MEKRVEESIDKRWRKYLASGKPIEREQIVPQITNIAKTIGATVKTLHKSGGGSEYENEILFQLADYKIDNIEKICKYVISHWEGAKSLPPVSFWLQCVTAVKSLLTLDNYKAVNRYEEADRLPQHEVKRMVSELGKSLGWGK